MTALNDALKSKDWEVVKELLKNPLMIDKDTLSFALNSGNISVICDVLEAGAKPNEDSLICAALSAPLFITIILNMLKAENKDIKKHIIDKYGSLQIEVSIASEDEMARIKRLETEHFWQAVWKRTNKPNFHATEVKEPLKQLLSSLNIKSGESIFVPFCGKSIDMLWLQQQGYHVLGIDISQEAIDAFCKENNLVYTEEQVRDFILREIKVDNGSLKLICGDIFGLQKSDISEIKIIYDRAGYIAIPELLRVQYAQLITNIFPKETKMLLGLFDFEEQQPFQGPPYFISEEEIKNLFSEKLEVHKFSEKRSVFFSTSSILSPQSKIEALSPTNKQTATIVNTTLLLKGIIDQNQEKKDEQHVAEINPIPSK